MGAIAIAAGLIFLIGVVFFLVFTSFTFEKMKKQIEIADLYDAQLGPYRTPPPKPPGMWSLTGIPIAIALTIGFIALDGWCFFGSKSQSGQLIQVTVPMKVQVGQQPEVTIDVPVKVTGP